MEEAFVSPTGKSKAETVIVFICYLLSTAFFSIMGVVEIIKAEKKNSYLKMFYSIPLRSHDDIPEAVYIETYITALSPFYDFFFFPEKGILYTVFLLMLGLAMFAFLLILLKLFFFRGNQIYNIAFGNAGRFLPLGILFATAGLFVPIVQDDYDYEDLQKRSTRKTRAVVGLIFSLITLIIFSIIYIFSGKCNSSIMAFIFKKCFISVFIAFHLMHFLYCVVYVDYYEKEADISYDFVIGLKYKDFYKDQALKSWMCILVFGIVCGLATWFYSDLFIGLIGTLFELGFLIYSTGIPTKGNIYDLDCLKKIKDANCATSAIVGALLLIATVATVAIKRKGCLE